MEIDIKEKIIEEITLDMDEIIFSQYFHIFIKREMKKRIRRILYKKKEIKGSKSKKKSNNVLLINTRINGEDKR